MNDTVGLMIGGLSVLFLIITLFILVHKRSQEEHRLLRTSSVATQGTIIGRKFGVYPDGKPDDSYAITYEFAAGRPWRRIRYSGTAGVDRSTYDSLKMGDSVTIVYVVGNPTISKLKNYPRPPIRNFRRSGRRSAARLDELSDLLKDKETYLD